MNPFWVVKTTQGTSKTFKSIGLNHYKKKSSSFDHRLERLLLSSAACNHQDKTARTELLPSGIYRLRPSKSKTTTFCCINLNDTFTLAPVFAFLCLNCPVGFVMLIFLAVSGSGMVHRIMAIFYHLSASGQVSQAASHTVAQQQRGDEEGKTGFNLNWILPGASDNLGTHFVRDATSAQVNCFLNTVLRFQRTRSKGW